MEVVYAPAFLRILKKFDPQIKEGVKTSVADVIDYYETGQKTPGLGLTQLRGNLWEARVGIRWRVLYVVGDNRLTFVLAGSHDDVRHFLRRL